MLSRPLRRPLKTAAIGLATGLVGALLVSTPLGFEFEQDFGLSWLFRVRGAVEPPADVVVVAIDASTADRLGEVELIPGSGRTQRLKRLPRDWPRTVHARLLDSLLAAGAAGVVFDMDFSLPKVAEDDVHFARAVFDARRVILFQRLTGKRQPLLAQDGSPRGWLWIEQTVPPIPELADAASGIGPFPLPKLDEALYQSWVFKQSAGDVATLPALALQLLALDRLDDLAALLERAGLDGIDYWPTSEQLRAGVADMQEFMIGLRHAFTFDQGLTDRARALLDGPDAEAMDPATRELLRSLLDLYAGPESVFLNFYGPPGTISTIPYHVALAADGAGGGTLDLSGKIAFVGYSDLYDPGQPDRFYTVFTRDDGVDLSGVEIAATAFANLLGRSPVRALEGLAAFALVCAFGMVVAILAYRLRAHLAVPLALALAAAYAALVQLVFARAALWLPLATPVMVQLPLALVAGLLGQYLFERHERRRVGEAIGYYLPEQVARELVDRGADFAAGNKVVHATCLATDMSGFTTLGEAMSPRDLATFMNDYFEALAEPLKAHAVDVTEFRADAIMCAWTADVVERRIRHEAVAAALDATAVVTAFGEGRGRALQARFGLDAGPVYVGHAGGGGHLVYTIVGDCANTASRIEGLNRELGTHVLASDAVAEGLDDLVTRPLGRFILTGKSEPVPIVEIVEYRSRADEAQLELCERFAEALEAFQAGRWRAAATRFAGLLEAYPGDRPTRMYLRRCLAFESEPPSHDTAMAIDLDRR